MQNESDRSVPYARSRATYQLAECLIDASHFAMNIYAHASVLQNLLGMVANDAYAACSSGILTRACRAAILRERMPFNIVVFVPLSMLLLHTRQSCCGSDPVCLTCPCTSADNTVSMIVKILGCQCRLHAQKSAGQGHLQTRRNASFISACIGCDRRIYALLTLPALEMQAAWR